MKASVRKMVFPVCFFVLAIITFGPDAYSAIQAAKNHFVYETVRFILMADHPNKEHKATE